MVRRGQSRPGQRGVVCRLLFLVDDSLVARVVFQELRGPARVVVRLGERIVHGLEIELERGGPRAVNVRRRRRDRPAAPRDAPAPGRAPRVDGWRHLSLVLSPGTAPRLLAFEAQHPPPPVRLRRYLRLLALARRLGIPTDEHSVVNLYVRRGILQQRQPRPLLRVRVVEPALPGDDRDEQPGLGLRRRRGGRGEARDRLVAQSPHGVPRCSEPRERDARHHQRRARHGPREKAATLRPKMLRMLGRSRVRSEAPLDVPRRVVERRRR